MITRLRTVAPPALTAIAALLLVVLAARAAATPPVAPYTATDSADVVGIVAQFHAALAAGDSSRALAILAPDALVLESGGIETMTEYRAHHLPADIEFAQAVASTRIVTRVVIRGDAAWVAATSTSQGTFRGPINSAGAELVTLRRQAGAWLIEAIHWSSRARRS